MSTENTQQQGGGNKDAEKFKKNYEKFMTLMSGKGNVFKNKVPNSQVDDVIEEMLEENRVAAKEAFKTKGKALLLKKVEFDKFIKAQEAATAKAILEKQKEFNTEIEALFNEIENIDSLAASMASVLKEVGGAATKEETPESTS